MQIYAYITVGGLNIYCIAFKTHVWVYREKYSPIIWVLLGILI